MSKEKQEATALKDKIQESDDIIAELENKLKERNETWQTEKKKLTSDIKLLKNEVAVAKLNISLQDQFGIETRLVFQNPNIHTSCYSNLIFFLVADKSSKRSN